MGSMLVWGVSANYMRSFRLSNLRVQLFTMKATAKTLDESPAIVKVHILNTLGLLGIGPRVQVLEKSKASLFWSCLIFEGILNWPL